MKLPYTLCEEEAKANSDQSGSCWNGHDADKYTNPVVSDGLVNQEHNPEVNVDISRPDVYINEQVRPESSPKLSCFSVQTLKQGNL